MSCEAIISERVNIATELLAALDTTLTRSRAKHEAEVTMTKSAIEYWQSLIDKATKNFARLEEQFNAVYEVIQRDIDKLCEFQAGLRAATAALKLGHRVQVNHDWYDFPELSWQVQETCIQSFNQEKTETWKKLYERVSEIMQEKRKQQEASSNSKPRDGSLNTKLVRVSLEVDSTPSSGDGNPSESKRQKTTTVVQKNVRLHWDPKNSSSTDAVEEANKLSEIIQDIFKNQGRVLGYETTSQPIKSHLSIGAIVNRIREQEKLISDINVVYNVISSNAAKPSNNKANSTNPNENPILASRLLRKDPSPPDPDLQVISEVIRTDPKNSSLVSSSSSTNNNSTTSIITTTMSSTTSNYTRNLIPISVPNSVSSSDNTVQVVQLQMPEPRAVHVPSSAIFQQGSEPLPVSALVIRRVPEDQVLPSSSSSVTTQQPTMVAPMDTLSSASCETSVQDTEAENQAYISILNYIRKCGFYPLRPFQQEFMKVFLEGKSFVAVACRPVGKTVVSALAAMSKLMYSSSLTPRVVVFCKNLSGISEFTRIVRQIAQHIPGVECCPVDFFLKNHNKARVLNHMKNYTILIGTVAGFYEILESISSLDCFQDVHTVVIDDAGIAPNGVICSSERAARFPYFSKLAQLFNFDNGVQTILLTKKCTKIVKTLAKAYSVTEYIEELPETASVDIPNNEMQPNELYDEHSLTKETAASTVTKLLTYEPDLDLENEEEPEMFLNGDMNEDELTCDPLAGTIIGEDEDLTLEENNISENTGTEILRDENNSDLIVVEDMKSFPEKEPITLSDDELKEVKRILEKRSNFYVLMKTDKEKLETLSCLGLGEDKAIIFCNSENKAEWLAAELKKKELDPKVIHQNIEDCSSILKDFTSDKSSTNLIVCTDLLLDFQAPDALLVINYELSKDSVTYCWRAGVYFKSVIETSSDDKEDSKLIVSFVDEESKPTLEKIGHELGISIEAMME